MVSLGIPKQVLLWLPVYSSILPESLYLSASVICQGADKHQWALSLLLRSGQERRQEKGRWPSSNTDGSTLRQTHESSQHTNTNSPINTCICTYLKLHTHTHKAPKSYSGKRAPSSSDMRCVSVKQVKQELATGSGESINDAVNKALQRLFYEHDTPAPVQHFQ